MEPLVSVILPTWNRGCWVPRAVESVLAQTHRRLEVIVVDDGSTDGTLHELRRFGRDITVLRQTHQGVYPARNRALAHASGEFVAFIDSDDVWTHDRLALQLPLLEPPATALVFGDAALVSLDASRALAKTCFGINPPHRGRVAGELVWANFVPTTTVLVRRASLIELGGFPTSHDRSADYVTWFRMALSHEFDFAPGVVAHYAVHGDGLSADLGGALAARIALFAAERERLGDEDAGRLAERALANLGLHLAVATLRGRARSVERPWQLVARALAAAPPAEVAKTSAGLMARRAARARGSAGIDSMRRSAALR